jgi:hypothetical protein
MTYTDLIRENFDTPERERSFADVKQIPHLSNWTYFCLLLLGGFPLFILFEPVRLAGWYLWKSVRNGRPCRLLFPKRNPDTNLLRQIDTPADSPEPQPWETEEQRQLAEKLAGKFVSPGLRPHVRPDTPLCLLNIRDVFMFLGIRDYEWGTIAKEHHLGQKDLNGIHRLLNASPYEAHTFRELVSMIQSAGKRNARRNDDFGCLRRCLPILLYFPDSILIYACTRSYVIPYGPPTFEHYISSPQVWLGLILFPFQYIWFLMWAAIWPGC